MNDTKLIVPLEQKEVVFYEDTIVAVRLEEGEVYVPIRPICDNLGVALAGQRERINRDPVLSDAITSVSVTLTQQAREMLCLPLKYIPGWLFGINANRVKPELRERIIRYQRECYEVLSEAFQEGRLTDDLSFEILLQKNTEAVRAYHTLRAMANLARSQILIEARLERVDTRLDSHEKRLEDIEASLIEPERKITEAQVLKISKAIKAIAKEAKKHSNKKAYGKMYEDMHALFGISAYKQLPAQDFDRVMAWLTERYQQLSGQHDDPPF